MFSVLTILAALLVLKCSVDLAHAASQQQQHCRCLPSDDHCWPDSESWKDFNESVDGTLIKVLPPAAPCHAPHFDEQACKTATAKWNLPFWRATQPGAMQSTNWERHLGQGCVLSSPSSSQCSQGALPVYAVAALLPSHVQSAVRFASQHNLRLVIKNTGHDYLGRSTAPGSLSIWLHKMKGMTFHDRFIAEGCLPPPADHQECLASGIDHIQLPSEKIVAAEVSSAVTVEAGVQWEEVYEATYQRKLMIVGGGSPSVGAAGGYVQGGGHSPFSPHFGLAADNVLQYEVVTADGKLLVANSCQNQELFWALRGGGGGTFGVVVSATHKTHPPFQSLAFTTYTFTAETQESSSSSKSSFHKLLTKFTELAPRFSDAGFGGFFMLTGQKLLLAFFLPNKNVSSAEESMQPLLRYAEQLTPELKVDGNFLTFPSFQDFRLLVQCEGQASCHDTTAQSPVGFPVAMASRLIPRATFEKSSEELSEALAVLSREVPSITGVLCAGGEVSKPRDNAVNPAWREALWEILLGTGWPDEASEAVQTEATKAITKANQLLIELTPGSGAYMNEADFNEPNWKESFFGAHYPRLYEIKQRVDPDGLFVCRHCVGSENWSDDLNCRTH